MGLRIRKGDTVLVISGKYKDATGRVLAMFPKDEKALVEGVNVVKKHQKAKSQEQPGGIIEKEMPIHLSKLMLVDPKTSRARRFRNVVLENGAKVRRQVIKPGEDAGSDL